MKSKKFVATVISILVLISVNAQNDLLFTHFSQNPVYYNPAFTGSIDKANATFQHRTQWAGYTGTIDQGGAPSTQLGSIAIPSQKYVSGFGLVITNDQLGELQSFNIQGQISFNLPLNSGDLSIGIAPALYSQSINGSLFRAVDNPDALIPLANESQARPNLNVGLFFDSFRDYYVGIAVNNILEPSFDFSTDAENRIYSLSYLIHAGKTIGITRELTLQPNALVRTDLNNVTFDVNAIFTYEETYHVGLGMRREESASLYLGYNLLENKQLYIGYSLDYVIQNQDAKQPTSHEIFVRYNLPSLVFGGRKAIKTPRFTF